MRNTLSLFCYILLFISFYSCNTIQSVDARINEFVDAVSNNQSSMTKADWDEADQKLESFKIELETERSSLTNEQISNANKAIGRYAGLRLKKGMGEFGEQLKDLGEQIEGVMNELADTSISK